MEGLFRARKASQCADSIPFLELWREEGHRLGLQGTLNRGCSGGELLSWVQFEAPTLMEPELGLLRKLRGDLLYRAPLREAPPLPSQQLMPQTPQSKGEQRQGNPNPTSD